MKSFTTLFVTLDSYIQSNYQVHINRPNFAVVGLYSYTTVEDSVDY